MSKVSANGIEVELLDGELVVSPPEVQELFDKMLKNQPPIGGTYFPPKDSLLSAYNVLENVFFGKRTLVKVEGELEGIPYEDGVIY